MQVMGMRAMARSDTGAAMAWALKSQDAKFTTYLADRLLSEYASTGIITFWLLTLIFYGTWYEVLPSILCFIIYYNFIHCHISGFIMIYS